MSQSEVENFWLKDRSNLIECGNYKYLLQQFYLDRDARIAGEKNV